MIGDHFLPASLIKPQHHRRQLGFQGCLQVALHELGMRNGAHMGIGMGRLHTGGFGALDLGHQLSLYGLWVSFFLHLLG